MRTNNADKPEQLLWPSKSARQVCLPPLAALLDRPLPPTSVTLPLPFRPPLAGPLAACFRSEFAPSRLRAVSVPSWQGVRFGRAAQSRPSRRRREVALLRPNITSVGPGLGLILLPRPRPRRPA